LNSKTDAVTKLFAKKVVFEYMQKARAALFFAFVGFAFYTHFRRVKSAFSYSHFIHRPIRTFTFSHFAFYTCPTRAVLSQGEPRDATVNLHSCWILQRHRAVSRPQHGVFIHISDSSNAEITPFADFHFYFYLYFMLLLLPVFSNKWLIDWLIYLNTHAG